MGLLDRLGEFTANLRAKRLTSLYLDEANRIAGSGGISSQEISLWAGIHKGALRFALHHARLPAGRPPRNVELALLSAFLSQYNVDPQQVLSYIDEQQQHEREMQDFLREIRERKDNERAD